MTDKDDKIKKFYNGILKSGKVSDSDFGGFEGFNNYMKDPEFRKKAYDNLIARGFTIANIGEYDAFSKHFDEYYDRKDPELTTGAQTQSGKDVMILNEQNGKTVVEDEEGKKSIIPTHEIKQETILSAPTEEVEKAEQLLAKQALKPRPVVSPVSVKVGKEDVELSAITDPETNEIRIDSTFNNPKDAETVLASLNQQLSGDFEMEDITDRSDPLNPIQYIIRAKNKNHEPDDELNRVKPEESEEYEAIKDKLLSQLKDAGSERDWKKIKDIKSQLDNAKEEYSKTEEGKLDDWFENLSVEQTAKTGKKESFGKEMVGRMHKGLNMFNASLASSIETIYDFAAIPQNKLADWTGWDALRVSSDGFKDKFGINNVPAEYYEKLIENNEKQIADNNTKYQHGIIESVQNGDWETAARNLVGGLTESLPSSLAVMISGGTLGTTATIGSSTVIFGGDKMRELKNSKTNLTEGDQALIAMGSGMAEGVFETFLGAGAMGGALNEIVGKLGKEAAETEIKKGVGNIFSQMIVKNPYIAMFGEGFEEVGTQYTQNAIDKYSGYRPEISLTDGVGDAFIMGVAMGSGFTAVGVGANKYVDRINEKEMLSGLDETQQKTIKEIATNFIKSKKPDFISLENELNQITEEYTDDQKATAYRYLAYKISYKGRKSTVIQEHEAQLIKNQQEQTEILNQLADIEGSDLPEAEKLEKIQALNSELNVLNKQNDEIVKAIEKESGLKDVIEQTENTENHEIDSKQNVIDKTIIFNGKNDHVLVRLTYPDGMESDPLPMTKDQYNDIVVEEQLEQPTEKIPGSSSLNASQSEANSSGVAQSPEAVSIENKEDAILPHDSPISNEQVHQPNQEKLDNETTSKSQKELGSNYYNSLQIDEAINDGKQPLGKEISRNTGKFDSGVLSEVYYEKGKLQEIKTDNDSYYAQYYDNNGVKIGSPVIEMVGGNELFDYISENGKGFEINQEKINQFFKDKLNTVKKIAEAENEVNTEPTEKQKEAGNYKKGHVKVQGFDITIEQPKGSIRKGTDENGNSWESKMNNTYGYFKRTKGKDGDQIDVFLGSNLESGNVYVVDQMNDDGSFDEHKVLLGFDSVEEAREAYLSNYEEGWQGMGNVTEVSLDEFKKWVGNGTRKQKPFSEYINVMAKNREEATTPGEYLANFPKRKPKKKKKVKKTEFQKNLEVILYDYPNTVKEAILQFLASGGRFSTDDFKRHSGFKGKELRTVAMLFLRSNDKGGVPMDLFLDYVDVNDSLKENWLDSGAMDITNEIMDILLNVDTYGSRSKIVAELVKEKEMAEIGMNRADFEAMLESHKEEFFEKLAEERQARLQSYMDEFLNNFDLLLSFNEWPEGLNLTVDELTNEQNEMLHNLPELITFGKLSEKDIINQFLSDEQRQKAHTGRTIQSSTESRSSSKADTKPEKRASKKREAEQRINSLKSQLGEAEGRYNRLKKSLEAEGQRHLGNLFTGKSEGEQTPQLEFDNDTKAEKDLVEKTKKEVEQLTSDLQLAEKELADLTNISENQIEIDIPTTSHKSKIRQTIDNNLSKDEQNELDGVLKQLRSKLGGQANMGIDPEVMILANRAAFLVIKSGVRGFADFARTMVSLVGDGIKPHLKSLYEFVKNQKEADSFYDEMTDSREVRKADIEQIISAENLQSEEEFSNFDKNNEDVSNRPENSQSDSESLPDESAYGTHVPNDRSRSEQKRDGVQESTGRNDQRSSGSKSSSNDIPDLFGGQSDNGLHQSDSAIQFESDDAGSKHSSGSKPSNSKGTLAKRESKADSGTNTGTDQARPGSFAELVEQNRKKQQAAESIPVELMSRDNISETLPFLLPDQQDDVFKAETRFFSPEHLNNKKLANGKGMLFTNGTGTGKTYTGLGIIKRFVKQGKGRVLIVVPSQPKVKDWADDGLNLGLDITPLENTQDKGSGVVVTTYANMRVNAAILEDVFDLIIYDESHRLMEDKKGKPSSTTYAHFTISNRTDGDALRRIQAIHPLWLREKELKDEIRTEGEYRKNSDLTDADYQKSENRENKLEKEWDEIREQQKSLKEELDQQAKDAYERTKVVFLSATPFKTHFNLSYANRILFDWGDETTYEGHSRVDPESRFFLDNFGSAWEWKYHRLQSKSDANPQAIAMQEMEFAEKMMQQGVQSGRAIESDMDYSREFPLVTGFNSELVNKAYNAIYDYQNKIYEGLWNAAREVFHNYNYTTKLFETLKASMSIPRIEKHLKLGRKVVVFHRRQQGDVEAPFRQILRQTTINAQSILGNKDSSKEEKEKATDMFDAVSKFEAEFPDLLEYESTLDYMSAVDRIRTHFGSDRVRFINGRISKGDKKNAIIDFNNDESSAEIIVVQEESGKEGISLHDTNGQKQRVLMSLSMPISSITALQIEGRIFRIGQMSDAIFEYPLLGLDLEIAHFGQSINRALSTTENLAIGNQSRDLIRSFAEGVLFYSSADDPHLEQGKGGKEYDRKEIEVQSEFQRAKLVYSTNQKQRGRRDQRKGVDYYPTPEPVGQKMVDWLQLKAQERGLEPSAGHGAIAMWFPKNTQVTAIEPAFELYSKLTARAGGGDPKVINSTFEDHHIVNKYEGIAMNPPFGSGGATAIKHIEKAFTHLVEGGRIVAIIPDGNSMAKKLDKFLYGVDEKERPLNPDALLRADFKMPGVMFKQAGTAINSRIVVIDKVQPVSLKDVKHKLKADNSHAFVTKYSNVSLLSDEELELQAQEIFNKRYIEPSRSMDFSSNKTVDDIFDAIEHTNVPDRVVAMDYSVIDSERSDEAAIEDVGEGGELKPINEFEHTQTGAILYNVAIEGKVEKERFKELAAIAKKHNPYSKKKVHNRYSGGFLFNEKNDAINFRNEALEGEKDIIFKFAERPDEPKHPNELIYGDWFEKQKAWLLDAKKITDHLSEDLGVKINFIVDMLYAPEKYKKKLKGKEGVVKGFFDELTGEVFVVAMNIENHEQLVRTVLHEVVGHKGLIKLMGSEYSALLDEVYQNIDEESKKKLIARGYDETDKREMAEEYFALIAESDPKLSWFQQIIAKLRDLLRSKFGVKYNLNDIKYLLQLSRKALKSNNDPDGGGSEIESEGSESTKIAASKDTDLKFMFNIRGDNFVDMNPEEQKNEAVGKFIERLWDGNKMWEDVKKILPIIYSETRAFLQDMDYPIKELMNEVLNSKKGYRSKGANPYVKKNLGYGRAEYLYQVEFKDKIMQPLINAVKKLRKAGMSYHQVFSYMIAKHAQERNAHLREQKFNEWLDFNEDASVDEQIAKKAELAKQDFSGVLELDKNTRKARELKYEIERHKYKIIENENSLGLQDWNGNLINENKFSTLKDEKLRKLAQDYGAIRLDTFENRPDQFATKMVNALESKVHYSIVSDFWKELRQATTFVILQWEGGSQITVDNAKKLMEMYDYYIPLRGWYEAAEQYLNYHYGDGKTASLQTAEGRKSLAMDPIAHIEEMGFHSILERVDNEAKLEMLEFVMQNYEGNKDKFEIKQIYYTMRKKSNGEYEWQATTEKPSKEMFRQGEAKRVLYTGHQRRRKPSQATEHEVIIHQNGMDIAIVFEGKYLSVAQAMNNRNTLIRVYGQKFDVGAMSKFARNSIFGQWVNFMKQMFTSKNIVFAAFTNFIRDFHESTVSTWIVSDHEQTGKQLKALPNSWKTMATHTFNRKAFNPSKNKFHKYAKEFMQNGSRTGYSHDKTTEDRSKEFKRSVTGAGKIRNAFLMKWLGDALTDISSIYEDATRLAVFIGARESGESLDEAARQAKDASVNFNIKGKAAGVFDTIIAFFNAAIQATAKNFGLAKHYPKRFTIAAFAHVIIGFIITELNRAVSGDDDEYERINNYVRENYLVLPIPFTDENYLRVPMSQFWRGFYSMGVILSDMRHGKKNVEEAITNGSLNFLAGLTPVDLGGFYVDGEFSWGPLVPTFYKPIQEIKDNRNFLGYQIYHEPFTQQLENDLADSKLHKKHANTAIKFITDGMYDLMGGSKDNKYKFYHDENGMIQEIPSLADVNPSKIEHLIKGYWGGTASETIRLGGLIAYAFSPDEEFSMEKVPVLSTFIREYPAQNWDRIEEYKVMKEELHRHKALINQNRQNMIDKINAGEEWIESKKNPIVISPYYSVYDAEFSLAESLLEAEKTKHENGEYSLEEYYKARNDIYLQTVENIKMAKKNNSNN